MSIEEYFLHIMERQKYKQQHEAVKYKLQHGAAEIRVVTWSGRNKRAAETERAWPHSSPSYSLADGSHKADNNSQADD
jgi:hypothetical protein